MRSRPVTWHPVSDLSRGLRAVSGLQDKIQPIKSEPQPTASEPLSTAEANEEVARDSEVTLDIGERSCTCHKCRQHVYCSHATNAAYCLNIPGYFQKMQQASDAKCLVIVQNATVTPREGELRTWPVHKVHCRQSVSVEVSKSPVQ